MNADTLSRTPSHTILAIPGSLRRESWNRLLLQAAAASAPTGMTLKVYDRLASVPLFSEDIEAEGVPAGVRHLSLQVANADAILIATPEYNQSLPGVLKNAIDWLSRAPEQVLVDKPVAIVGATAGRWGTRLAQSQLRHVLYATEALVMPRPSLFVASAANLFDSAGRLTDEPTAASLQKLLRAFANWIARADAGARA
jgi:chromate reductase